MMITSSARSSSSRLYASPSKSSLIYFRIFQTPEASRRLPDTNVNVDENFQVQGERVVAKEHFSCQGAQKGCQYDTIVHVRRENKI